MSVGIDEASMSIPHQGRGLTTANSIIHNFFFQKHSSHTQQRWITTTINIVL